MSEVEQEPTLEELVDRRQLLKDLLKSAGWGEYSKVLTEQLEVRKAADSAMDLESQKDVYELIRIRAERRALDLALSLPAVLVETLDEQIEEERDGARSDR